MLEGKTALILGVANHRSIAWAIGKRIAAAGARLVLTYQGERLKENVEELARELPGTAILPCDVTKEEEIQALRDAVQAESGALDLLIHSVAFAPREELKGRFMETSRAGYLVAQEISAYSLTALARAFHPLMAGRSASILTLTYQGSTRVFPGYNVMGVAKAALEASVRYLAADLGPDGIRVNALSAGPLKTLASAGIAGFSGMMAHHRDRCPLRRDTEADEVADAAYFLLSPMARGITGEILHVDGGYHIMG